MYNFKIFFQKPQSLPQKTSVLMSVATQTYRSCYRFMMPLRALNAGFDPWLLSLTRVI